MFGNLKILVYVWTHLTPPDIITCVFFPSRIVHKDFTSYSYIYKKRKVAKQMLIIRNLINLYISQLERRVDWNDAILKMRFNFLILFSF